MSFLPTTQAIGGSSHIRMLSPPSPHLTTVQCSPPCSPIAPPQVSGSDIQPTPPTHNNATQHVLPEDINGLPERAIETITIYLSPVISLLSLWFQPLFQSPPHLGSLRTYLTENHAVQLSHIIKFAGNMYHLFLLSLPELYAGRARSITNAFPTSTGTPQWNSLLASFIGEWKKLNVASALIFIANLAILQFHGAFNYIDVRTAGFLSLACAFLSLLYGNLLIFCFGAFVTRGEDNPGRWTELVEGRSIWWNISILVALPAIWAGWSATFLVLCLLLFLWRADMTGATSSDIMLVRGTATAIAPKMTFAGGLASCLTVTAVFVVGGVYLILAVRALRS